MYAINIIHAYIMKSCPRRIRIQFSHLTGFYFDIRYRFNVSRGKLVLESSKSTKTNVTDLIS